MTEAERYAALRTAIAGMVTMPYGEEYDFGISQKAGDAALAHLTTLEEKGTPAPLLIPENDGGLTLKWTLADWRLYRTFEEDGEMSDMIGTGKNSDILDRRGAFGGDTLPTLPLQPLRYHAVPV